MGAGSEHQAAFARALLDQDAAVPVNVEGRAGGNAERRFSVYRNNVHASLVNVLAGRFPVSQKLVGQEFFRAMARVFVGKTPPASALLLNYGGEFPDFVAGFPAACAVPYLSDVARLEWAWHSAYHAADAAPLSPEDLAVLGDGVAQAALRLHPSLRFVRSDYPVVTIWELAARDGEDEPVRLPANGEDALVLRPRLDVEVRRLPEGGAAFVAALQKGTRLTEAAEIALAMAPGFDLAANLAGLMRSGAIAGTCERGA